MFNLKLIACGLIALTLIGFITQEWIAVFGSALVSTISIILLGGM